MAHRMSTNSLKGSAFPLPKQSLVVRVCQPSSLNAVSYRPLVLTRPCAAAASSPTLASTSEPEKNACGGEKGRQDLRDVYNFAAWQKHRSPTRYFSRLLRLGRSNILKNVLPSIVWVMFLTVLVGLYCTAQSAGIIPTFMPNISSNTACTSFIQQTSVALSLLLVFRTNTSYGRWDEVRKMWGTMLQRSRDLALQVATYVPNTPRPLKAKQAMERWLIAFGHVMRIHFQNEGTVHSLLGHRLRPSELEALDKSNHRPMTALAVLTRLVNELPVGTAERLVMMSNVTAFQDLLGGCERILRAPIPVSYTNHTARFLFVWLSTLPFALWPTCGWAAVPLSGAVAAVLGGIEEIGVQCEEPFGILNLDSICRQIETDVIYSLQDTVVDGLVAEAVGEATLNSDVATAAAAAAGNGSGSQIRWDSLNPQVTSNGSGSASRVASMAV